MQHACPKEALCLAHVPLVDQGYFDLVIKEYPDGNVSKHMHGLKVGDKVLVSTLATKWNDIRICRVDSTV